MIDILFTLGLVFSICVLLFGAYLAIAEAIDTAGEVGEDQQ